MTGDPAPRRIVALTALLFALPLAARADRSIGGRMEEIEKRIKIEVSKLERVQEEEERITKELEALKRSIEELNEREDHLSEELNAKSASKSAVDLELYRTDREIGKLREHSRQRIRELFMTRSPSLAEHLLASEASERQQIAYFSGKIHDYDVGAIEHLGRLKRERLKLKQELDPVISEHSEKKQIILQQKESVSERIARQEGLLSDLQRQQAKEEQILAALRSQAASLERMVSAMTGGSPEEAPPEDEVPSREPPAPRPEPFQAAGLAHVKGKLDVPAPGSVVQRFGKQKHPEFEDLIFSRGLELRTASGGAVSAVAPGRVIYVGNMPGYGTIVILDHGQRYYTLYGRLSSVAVAKDRIVRSGEKVGNAGTADAHGRNLYFEIRKDGAPVNPQQFFREPIAVIG